MFLRGLIIGLFIGCVVAFLVMALCKMASISDKYMNDEYKSESIGDDNENN